MTFCHYFRYQINNNDIESDWLELSQPLMNTANEPWVITSQTITVWAGLHIGSLTWFFIGRPRLEREHLWALAFIFSIISLGFCSSLDFPTPTSVLLINKNWVRHRQLCDYPICNKYSHSIPRYLIQQFEHLLSWFIAKQLRAGAIHLLLHCD